MTSGAVDLDGRVCARVCVCVCVSVVCAGLGYGGGPREAFVLRFSV